MTIFTQWGGEVQIVANCGEHRPKGFKAPAILVRVQFPGDGTIGPWCEYRFIHTLKADDGFREIGAALEKAPVEKLDPTTLKLAIHEAL